MSNVRSFANQRKTAGSSPGAIRKADDFLAANAERIPGELLAAGLREVLIHFATKQVVEGRVVMFALPDEAAPRARSEFDLVCTLFAELPPVEISDADDGSVQLDLAAQREISSAWTGRGEKIDYKTAVRLASEKQEAVIHPPDVDQESQRLDSAAQAEIEAAWKSRGERLPYLDALRLAEAKKGGQR